MTNVAKIPRAYIALGLCLPLAVLLGYLIAEPIESGTLAVMVLVFSVLLAPLLMKWYHPLLIFSANACITPFFLPGQFSLWIVMAAIGIFFTALNRSVNPARKLIYIPAVTKSLLFLAGVVAMTAVLSGGIGIHSLGGAMYGGSRYVYIFAAIATYFALTSRRIPVEKAGFYLGMFFLPGLTALISNVAYSLGPSFYFLYYLFPAGSALEQAMADYSMEETIVRIGGLSLAAVALYSYLLGRFGLRGVFDFSRPLRFLFFLAAALACVATGFRSTLILFGAVIAILFCLEGLHRTRWLPIFGGLGIALALVVLPNAYKLPLSVQRTLSFLPANVSPLAEDSAASSSEWRLQMWREVLPDIPKYLLKGKGYLINPEDILLGNESVANSLDPHAAVKAAGDYHSGPLSILIPLGAFGMIAFLWFLIASIRVLHRYYRTGDPRLRNINAFLLAAFIAKAMMFFLIFGGFYGQLIEFTMLIGFAVSLNGGVPERPSKLVDFDEASAAFRCPIRERGRF